MESVSKNTKEMYVWYGLHSEGTHYEGPSSFCSSFLPLQGVFVAAGVLAAPAGPPLRHLPRHPLQLRGRPDRHDGRGPRRLRRTLLLPHLRRRRQDRQGHLLDVMKKLDNLKKKYFIL